MGYFEINEEKWAKILILEKILDLELFGSPTTQLKTSDDREFYGNFIDETIILNGVRYKISNHIFKKIMEELHSKKSIELIFFNEMSVLDQVDDQFSFIVEAVKLNPDISEEELKQEKTFYCRYVVNELEKIKDEIVYLNTLGVLVDQIKETFPKFEYLENSPKVSFDSDQGILKIGTKEVKLRKFSDQYHFISVLFKDNFELSKEWFFSEICEIYDSSNQPPDKKFYNACDQVKKKVALEAGIRDLFITTRQSIKINSKYLM